MLRNFIQHNVSIIRIHNFEINIDEYKILINIEAKPKVIKNAKDFYEKRSVLENKLTKEFSIERWKTNAVVIQTMIEM